MLLCLSAQLMVNKLLCFCSTNKQGLSWDTSVFQLGLIFQMLLKMLWAVQNISEYKRHDGGLRNFFKLLVPTEYEISIIYIGYRPVNDEHRIAPLLWQVLMYTHGSDSVWP